MAGYEDTSGREPITIVEIDQVQCQLTYGTSPCQAVLGTTGQHKCFNGFASCQDTANFDPGTLTLRFVTPRANLPRDLGTLIPCLDDYKTRPTTIDIDNGLGRRAKVDVSMVDFPYHDRAVDKYAQERVSGNAQADGQGYDPRDRGTFWSKWLRRNPYHQGWSLRIREGYVGQPLSEMRVRHYVIERIEGPNSKGQVKIVAKDVLKQIDGDRAQVPKPSNGRLSSGITESDTSATLAPSGIGDEEYPSSGLARISDELVDFTRSGDTLTLTRAVRGTEADEHDADDTVQLCYTMDGDSLPDVLEDILTNYAPLSGSFIPKADWDNEAAEWLVGFELAGEITEPTGVDEVVETMLRQSQSYIWWDEYAQEIKLQAIKPPISTVRTLTDDEHLIADTVNIKRMPDDRRSRVFIYYDIIKPTEDREQENNYAKLRGRIDTDSESENEFGETRVKTIFAPFFEGPNTGAVIAMATRTLHRLRDTPEHITFSLDAKDREIGTGDVIDVQTRQAVDLTGGPEARRYQVIERDEEEAGHRVKYVAQNFEFSGRFAFVMENSAVDYGNATDEVKNDNSGFVCPNAGEFADGSEAYKII